MTDAERALWRHLRGEQMRGLKFRRQYPIAGYIADFACIEARMAIELDGGQHLLQMGYDRRRSLMLERDGYRVLRFWNDQVLLEMDAVLAEIFRQISTPPRPSPASRGGG